MLNKYYKCEFLCYKYKDAKYLKCEFDRKSVL